MVARQSGAPLGSVEVDCCGRAVAHGAAGRLWRSRVGHLRRLRDGLQIPSSSLLSRGVARAEVVGLPLSVASVHLVQPPVLPGADAVETRVAGFRGDEGLGGRGGALGGRGVARQRRHGVCLGFGERDPVVWTVRTAT